MYCFCLRQTKYAFRGERIRSREDFSLRMYSDEVQAWAEEFNASRQQTIASLDRLRHCYRQRPNSHLGDCLQDLGPQDFDSPMSLVIDTTPRASPDSLSGQC